MRCMVFLLLLASGSLSAQTRKPTIYTVNYPLQVFAAAIGGDNIVAEFPAPADVDPAYWQPDTDTLLAYQRADLIALNGAGYAKWVSRAVLPRSRLVDTSAAFADRLIAGASQTTQHVHGPKGAHEHTSDYAFTTWLDLSLAREQAAALLEAMTRRWPEHADAMAERHGALDQRLADLDAALEQATAVYAGRPLLASHPVYQYLARRYRLDVESLHWEPGEDPSDDAWNAFDALYAAHPATLMLWEGEPTAGTRQRLAERGIAVVVVPTLGNRPAAGDFFDQLEESARALVGR